MTTPTAARTTPRKDAHWYAQDGTPMHTVIAKGNKQPRPATIRDARELKLLPSATSILKLLHKQALVDWMIEQAVLACLTSPRKEGEEIDAFVHRVLHVEEVQHQERNAAADKGKEIHAALQDYFQGQEISEALKPFIVPVTDKLLTYGKFVASEKVLIGEGYAGTTDLILEGDDCFWMADFKSTEKLPDPAKGAWMENRLQLAAYAEAFSKQLATAGSTKPIHTMNVYVHRSKAGEFVICEHDDWRPTYVQGFEPLVIHWQWANNYRTTPEVKSLPRAVVEGVREKLAQGAAPVTIEAKAPATRRTVVTTATGTPVPSPAPVAPVRTTPA